jgi:spore maturation protein CgeB
MKIALFCHSLVSDWNHGNAHFLRGVVSELLRRHDVRVYEPHDAWSVRNLIEEHGEEPIRRFSSAFPHLRSTRYDEATLDLDEALDADLVIVHEWNSHSLVRRIGEHRASTRRARLLFHDTHHRSLTGESSMSAYDLRHYDGVLAFGEVIRQIYLERGWARRVWTWHEAADTQVFHPVDGVENEGDLMWIGNWGDGERTVELQEFLLEPVRELGLKARAHGVRYPPEGIAALAAAGVEYQGWIANYDAPRAFAAFSLTMHVPRRPYAQALPGIPTIRVFEALACGIPLVSAPWDDAEGLFTPGADYVVAHHGREMRDYLRMLMNDSGAAQQLAAHGLRTVRARHTCAHRARELMDICAELGIETRTALAEANA